MLYIFLIKWLEIFMILHEIFWIGIKQNYMIMKLGID